MDKISMCEIGGLQIGSRQRGETEHHLLQERRFQIDGRAALANSRSLAASTTLRGEDGGRRFLRQAFHASGPPRKISA